jgi:Spy/CpxP family protein refolding chaperone
MLALCVFALPLAATADGPPGPPGRRGPPPFERILERHAERLGLDDATRAKIREVADAGRDARNAQQKQLHALRDELRALLSVDAPVESEVLAKAEEIGRVETGLEKERLRSMLAIRALLTPAQRSELVEIHRERRERRRGEGDREGTRRPWRERDLGE